MNEDLDDVSTSRRRLSAASLLAGFATMGSLLSQVPEASYPLLTDLNDATMNYGPMMLLGNNPPAPPANGVCVNGVYLFSGGQDARTPAITGLDTNDFQLEVDFQIASFPGFNSPILVGGDLWRWIGFVVQPGGTLGVLYNNSIIEWSATTVVAGTWYSGTIKYEGGMVELHLDGVLVHQATIGPLNTGNDLDFTTNNFSNATAFNGCIRNLLISNDTTLGPTSNPIGNAYCAPAVANSTGSPAVLSADGSVLVSMNDVTLNVTQLPPNANGYFLNSMTQGNTPMPGGSQGTLCLGGSIGRYVAPGQIRNAGAAGEFSLVLDLGVTPTPMGAVAIAAGQTWNFQAWYRDANPNVTSNFTNGLTIAFQ